MRKKIKKVRKEYERERQQSLYRGTSQRERELARQLSELLHREEILARQRPRVDWLKAGDRNTAFFHARASARRSQNRIRTLKREDGVYCEKKEEAEVNNFYVNLYTSQGNLDINAVLDYVPQKVTGLTKGREKESASSA